MTAFDFTDQGALIIGAGQNIGRAIALEFASRGARVAVADISLEGAKETAALINAAGGTAQGLAPGADQLVVVDDDKVVAGFRQLAAFSGR